MTIVIPPSYMISAAQQVDVGVGCLARLPDWLKSVGSSRPLLIMDSFFARHDAGKTIIGQLQADAELHVIEAPQGEPKMAYLEDMLITARSVSCDAVIGIGGGSVLDSAKIIGICLGADKPVAHYEMIKNPLPAHTVPRAMVPTTAGTGSEASSTNILALENGQKGWVWGPETKPDMVFLDAELLVSLPHNLTIWTGMDAIIHAFESAVNKFTHAGAQFYAHHALRLAATALPRCADNSDDREARQDMLLASYYAGRSLDMCSASLAHWMSHAIAGIKPVHHGLATALSFEICLPHLLAANPSAGEAAAQAFGAESAAALPDYLSQFFVRIGLERKLPDSFSMVTADDIFVALQTPETESIRLSCPIYPDDELARRYADALAALS
ncbi:iron-containing alcohol dehydrogenase [Alphaproteobacteria bacterium]|nr:iron-containing alcohol dehydrogenase [Alphaproteobacteria bacterium]